MPNTKLSRVEVRMTPEEKENLKFLFCVFRVFSIIMK